MKLAKCRTEDPFTLKKVPPKDWAPLPKRPIDSTQGKGAGAVGQLLRGRPILVDREAEYSRRAPLKGRPWPGIDRPTLLCQSADRERRDR